MDFHSNFSFTGFVASLFVVVKQDGTVHAVNYQEMGNEIFGVYEGKLDAEEAATLFKLAGSPQVKKALIKEAAYRTAPGDFDFYELGVQYDGVIASKTFKTSNKLPKTIDNLVNRLLYLPKRLTRVEPPFWYLRSGLVTADRRSGLEERFNVRFASLKDYPENARSFVETALKCPGHFIPLSEEEHSAMLKGFNRYITQGEKSFDLTFFDGWRFPKPLPEPQRTSVKPD